MVSDVADLETKIRSLTIEEKTEWVACSLPSWMGRLMPTPSARGWTKLRGAIVKWSKASCGRFSARKFSRVSAHA